MSRDGCASPARRRGRHALAVAVLVGMPVVVTLYRRVLSTAQSPSWPPSPGVVTSAGAQAATQSYGARHRPPAHEALEFAWSTAATIEPWAEGVNFFPRIFADIEAASSSVHILMFGWREGEVGTQMAALLKRKLADGVEVRVIVDRFGSRPYAAAREMFAGLAAAGAEIVVSDFSPLCRYGLFPDRQRFAWRGGEFGRVDHRKLYVVDGAVGWIGGAGLEDHFRNGGFHDLMVRVTGDVVRQTQAAFLTSFHGRGGSLPIDLSRLFPEQAEPGTIPVALTEVMPGGFGAATQAIREQIDATRDRLDIMNAYATDPDMIRRIIAAARRGVHVRVVVSETSNNRQATAALRHRYGDMIAAGVEIWELPGTVVHAKVVVADDVVSFGTVNLDAWALYRNWEIMMTARSATVAELLEGRLFDPDIARAKRGNPPSASRERFESWLWNKLSFFL
ncbi:MAG: phospholipase D-like domain-containing protein [Gaiellaceae bacterium]